MPYTIKKALPPPPKKMTLRNLIIRANNAPSRVQSLLQEQNLISQCGMTYVFGVSETNPSQQDQALYFAFALFAKPESYEKLEDAQFKGQIVFSDVVDKKGRPFGSDFWYESKMVSIRDKTAGPVTVNPNSGNYVRHFTITPRQLLKIFNFKK